MMNKFINLFVALVLAVYYFYLLLPMTECPRPYDGNILNTALFTEHSHYAYTTNDFQAGWPDWKTRLPGPMITGWITDKVVTHDLNHRGDFGACSFGFGAWRYSDYKCAFAAYHSFWLLLTFGLLIHYRKDALLIILGTFSGMMVCFSMPSYQVFYPWDLPSLFFFTWAILIYDSCKRMLPLCIVVALGAIFKETALCCALLILFGRQWPLPKRIIGFVCTLAAFAVIKKLLILDYAVQVPSIHSFNWQLGYNWNEFLHPKGTSFVLANAGALLIMMLLPAQTYRQWLLKGLAASFITGQFLFGVVTEFRIWYEILPLGWMMISEYKETHEQRI